MLDPVFTCTSTLPGRVLAMHEARTALLPNSAVEWCVARGVAGSGGAGSAIFAMGLSPAELALTYSTCLGGFNPPPQLPQKNVPSHSKRLHGGSVCTLFAEVTCPHIFCHC